MSSLNEVNLLGRLGRDPGSKDLPNDKTVTKLSLCTTKSYKDENGEWKEIPEWHNVVCWGNNSKIAQKYLSKGSQVFIKGELKTRSWDDQDGKKRYATEIIAQKIIFETKKQENNNTQDNYSTPIEVLVQMPREEDEDDLPF